MVSSVVKVEPFSSSESSATFTERFCDRFSCLERSFTASFSDSASAPNPLSVESLTAFVRVSTIDSGLVRLASCTSTCESSFRDSFNARVLVPGRLLGGDLTAYGENDVRVVGETGIPPGDVGSLESSWVGDALGSQGSSYTLKVKFKLVSMRDKLFQFDPSVINFKSKR